MKREATSNGAALLGILLALPACDGHGDREQSTTGSVADSGQLHKPPLARIDVVEDQYHEQTVADPYRWLEDGDDDVVEWADRQGAYARNFLDALPERAALKSMFSDALRKGESVSYGFSLLAGNKWLLALKFDPGKQQPTLVAMNPDGGPASERVILDPNVIDPTGLTIIDWYVPSHGGSLVAVSLSMSGSEWGDVRIIDIQSAEQVDTVIERVNGGTARGDIAWFPDDSGFYYTRYPRVGERPEEDLPFYQQVWQHALGTPADEDTYVIGREFPRIAEIRILIHRASGRLLVWVQDGDSGRFAMYLRQPNEKWQKISEFGDGYEEARFGADDQLYVISRAGAPRGQILLTDASAPDLPGARILVPEGDGAIANSFYFPFSPTLLPTAERLYVVYDIGGPNELHAFDLDGKPAGNPDLPDVSSIVNLAHAGGDDIYYCTMSYTSARQWHRFDSDDDATSHLAMSSETPQVYASVGVVREFATSPDGTQVPVNILIPPGAEKDGTRAIIVTGYGGYGISMSPVMSRSVGVLMENGVLYAQANLRGGSEYGSDWHDQGRLTKKQNVFDDFAAVIRHLVREGYAHGERVGIIGGSNGGLLMGATLVQNPGLVAAVSSRVGIYDMLRSELDANGEFNIPEFGTVQDPAQFEALLAYSPYHNIDDGTDYPPILLSTGANDPRVDPYHSRKFAARLQAAQDGNGTVLLRLNADTGHGMGTPLDEVIELQADQYAFLLHYLSVPVADH